MNLNGTIVMEIVALRINPFEGRDSFNSVPLNIDASLVIAEHVFPRERDGDCWNGLQVFGDESIVDLRMIVPKSGM